MTTPTTSVQSTFCSIPTKQRMSNSLLSEEKKWALNMYYHDDMQLVLQYEKKDVKQQVFDTMAANCKYWKNYSHEDVLHCVKKMINLDSDDE